MYQHATKAAIFGFTANQIAICALKLNHFSDLNALGAALFREGVIRDVGFHKCSPGAGFVVGMMIAS